jgi:hypothetical protein
MMDMHGLQRKARSLPNIASQQFQQYAGVQTTTKADQ